MALWPPDQQFGQPASWRPLNRARLWSASFNAFIFTKLRAQGEARLTRSEVQQDICPNTINMRVRSHRTTIILH